MAFAVSSRAKPCPICSCINGGDSRISPKLEGRKAQPGRGKEDKT